MVTFVMEYNVHKCALEIASKNKIIILIHASPDGDCVGSGSALAMMLFEMGKDVKLLCPHLLPTRLEFICEYVPENILYFGRDIEKDFIPDYIISVDIASPNLLGKLRDQYGKKVNLCIDHHIINTMEAENAFVNPNASACGEIIFELGKEFSSLFSKNFLTKQVCDMLYAAIALDTGSFMHGNVTTNTFLCASYLKHSGADTENISKRLFSTKSVAQYKLTGLAASKTEFLHNGKIACCLLLNEDIETCGAKNEDVDCITRIFQEIEGVEVSVFLREYKNDIENEYYIKASLRSNADINVAKICECFGGGGHVKAAACAINGKTVKEAGDEIIAKAIELYPELANA